MKVLVLLFLVACNDCNPKPEPVQPRVYGDDASDVCIQACAKLTAWNCPEGQPTPAGERCESFCSREPLFLDAPCVARTEAKSNLGECNVRCGQ